MHETKTKDEKIIQSATFALQMSELQLQYLHVLQVSQFCKVHTVTHLYQVDDNLKTFFVKISIYTTTTTSTLH